MTSLELAEAISNCDYVPMSYSGRGMMGKYCVAVNLNSDENLWNLCQALTIQTHDNRLQPLLCAPRTDNMGMGIVAYWPSYSLCKEDMKKMQQEYDDTNPYDDNEGENEDEE